MRNDAFPNDILLHSTTLTLETTATLAPPPPSFFFIPCCFIRFYKFYLRILKIKSALTISTLDIFLSSNHNIHKSSHGLCFWASDPS